MTNHKLISFSAVQIYDRSCIHLHRSPSRVYNELTKLPVGTGIAEVMGSNPVQTGTFFPGFNFTTA